jgi:hypothetical protein
MPFHTRPAKAYQPISDLLPSNAKLFCDLVCGILGLKNSRKVEADHVEREDRDGVTIRDAIGRNQRQSEFLAFGLRGRGQIEADKDDIHQVGRCS